MSMHMWQCIICKKYMYSENTILRHCNKLVQHIYGIEGKGIDMNSPKVRVNVSGYITIGQDILEDYLTRRDPHASLVSGIHLGFIDSSELVFDTPDE